MTSRAMSRSSCQVHSVALSELLPLLTVMSGPGLWVAARTIDNEVSRYVWPPNEPATNAVPWIGRPASSRLATDHTDWATFLAMPSGVRISGGSVVVVAWAPASSAGVVWASRVAWAGSWAILALSE